MKKLHIFIISLIVGTNSQAQSSLYRSNSYNIDSNAVYQGKYEAIAVSANNIKSNYESPVNLFQSADISFKFSINQRDNEMSSGIDHQFSVIPVNGIATTPIIKFGQQLKISKASEKFLAPNTTLVIKVDMRTILDAFKTQGFYVTFKGDKIYKEDFKGLFVAGATAPMSWDFDNLHQIPSLQLKDDDGDGIFETTLILNKSNEQKSTAKEWKLEKNIADYPQFKAQQLLPQAIYNLSVEEMLKAIEPDSTFRTGKEWSGVWTRDISYSIILSMAYLQPRVAIFSLMKKVNSRKRIIQDTGTGGAWPVSSDRTIWSVAAWELYKATGDVDWLKYAFEVIQNTMEDDLQTVYNKEKGLFRGESSFLDWREQTYPSWMQPADIYESYALGTNAAFYHANVVLHKMASLLNDKSANKYLSISNQVKTGINKYLWIPEKNYYAQYLYGRNYQLSSPRAEALGEALCIIYGIADDKKAKAMVASMPITDFGIPCIYPQIPNIPPYHNNAIWPFVQSFWLWASAKAGNEKAVMEGIASIYRPAALFLTNKENMVADNGDFNGTQINSSVMLWSLSGNISIVHRILFGIQHEPSELIFSPFVPKAMAGKLELNNFKYRGATLNISIEGYGNKIARFELDGKESRNYSVSAALTGNHHIKIILKNELQESSINRVVNYISPSAPNVVLELNTLRWEKQPNISKYKIIKNGKNIATIKENEYKIETGIYASYSVIAVDTNAVESFTSEPIEVVNKKYVRQIELESFAQKSKEHHKGFSGSGFIEISKKVNKEIAIPIEISEAGNYLLQVKYANGNGPKNTENKCAIRTLKVNSKKTGVLIFPQRGANEWSNWGMSNSLRIDLKKGKNIIWLSLEDVNENMNGEVNQAMLDYIQLIKISD